jgi:RNA methyltransferase, trmH family, group 3
MLVCGRNVAKEILLKDKKIKKCYLQEGFKEETILSLLEKKKIKINYFDKNNKDDFFKMPHQGIILDIEDFKYSPIEDLNVENAKIIILDHLEDPHNLGAIVRTVEAANLTGIIIPKDRATDVNYTVVKTSAGAIENVKISQVTNINSTILKLKELGFWIVGTTLEAKEDFKNIDYSGKIAVVIGNEGKGISESTIKHLDFNVKIPMYGTTNSLNASVAAALMIYEIVRKGKDE